MKYLNLSRLLMIIGVFLLCTFIYYPRNKIIEVKLADIEENDDINTTINYPFEIRWDDAGFENNRPSSITYNLYNVLDENTIVSTVTLTSSNVDSEDANKWNGIFTNVRKYNADESKRASCPKGRRMPLWPRGCHYLQAVSLPDG